MDSGPIKVSNVSLVQLSRGLYRSNAAAFKELVSNAWDADATQVRVDTNYPEFNFISCVDNGPGMQKHQFMNYFNGRGIGFCFKRKGGTQTTTKYKRPIIGRLGIGMLAIGQLCHSFRIESHYTRDDGTGEAYRATIVLKDLDILDIEQNIMSPTAGDTEDLQVGRWTCEDIPYDASKKGFRIFSSDVRETFTAEMRGGLDQPSQKPAGFNLSDLHARVYQGKRSIRECGPYFETIWELCVLCPLPYYWDADHPIKLAAFCDKDNDEGFDKALGLIKERHRQMLDYTFTVIFDGISLARYIQLPTTAQTHPRLFHTSFAEEVAGRRLSFSGYLFAQTQAIRPLELDGIQIRLRCVGISGYDSSFLKYYTRIGTIKDRWVTGELFVDEGLEPALNIDRDSFNEHDEHFKELQKHLHGILGPIFSQIDSVAGQKRERTRVTLKEELQASLCQTIAARTGGKLELLERDLGKTADLVLLDELNHKIILNTSQRPLRKKKANTIIRHVMAAYYIARSASKPHDEQVALFYELLKDILQELV